MKNNEERSEQKEIEDDSNERDDSLQLSLMQFEDNESDLNQQMLENEIRRLEQVLYLNKSSQKNMIASHLNDNSQFYGMTLSKPFVLSYPNLTKSEANTIQQPFFPSNDLDWMKGHNENHPVSIQKQQENMYLSQNKKDFVLENENLSLSDFPFGKNHIQYFQVNENDAEEQWNVDEQVSMTKFKQTSPLKCEQVKQENIGEAFQSQQRQQNELCERSIVLRESLATMNTMNCSCYELARSQGVLVSLSTVYSGLKLENGALNKIATLTFSDKKEWNIIGSPRSEQILLLQVIQQKLKQGFIYIMGNYMLDIQVINQLSSQQIKIQTIVTRVDNITFKQRKELILSLDDPNLITIGGSAQATLPLLDDKLLSSIHAFVSYNSQGIFITDNNSNNGQIFQYEFEVGMRRRKMI